MPAVLLYFWNSLRRFAGSSARANPLGCGSSFRPSLEPLEDRAVPAVFPVTTLADAGAGSLRQAIVDANDRPGSDRIEFGPSVRGTITLTSGELSITDDLTVNGPGADTLTVSGNNASRIFAIDGTTALVSVSLSGMSLVSGRAERGGGILVSQAVLEILSCVLAGNFATGARFGGGGGIYSSLGTLTVARSTLSGNVASPSAGGAIYNFMGTLTVTGSVLSGNSATGLAFGGGGASTTPWAR